MPCVGEYKVAEGEVYISGSYGINWYKCLASTADTVEAVTILVLNEAGEDVTTTIAPFPGVINDAGQKTTCKLEGFEKDQSYRVFHYVTTAAGNELNDYLLIHCV